MSYKPHFESPSLDRTCEKLTAFLSECYPQYKTIRQLRLAIDGSHSTIHSLITKPDQRRHDRFKTYMNRGRLRVSLNDEWAPER